MPSRPVVPTDESLQSGQPLPRAYIAQLDDQFAQILANLMGSMDDIVNNPEAPMTAKVNAARESRQLLVVQMELLNDIERRQDAQEMENRTHSLRNMVANNPRQALAFIESEIVKLNEAREFVQKIADASSVVVSIADSPFEATDVEPF